MAIRSSILAGKIRRTEEPGGQHSVGLQGVGHDLASNTQGEQDHRLMELESPFTGLAVVLQEGKLEFGVWGSLPHIYGKWLQGSRFNPGVLPQASVAARRLTQGDFLSFQTV